jgi:hypothetical protein
VSETPGAGTTAAMTDDQKPEPVEEHDGELLPPREVLSVLNTDPSAYAGLLADPTSAGTAGPDPAAGATDTAGSTADSAHSLADAQSAADGTQTVSDQPQTITTDSTETASSQT